MSSIGSLHNVRLPLLPPCTFPTMRAAMWAVGVGPGVWGDGVRGLRGPVGSEARPTVHPTLRG